MCRTATVAYFNVQSQNLIQVLEEVTDWKYRVSLVEDRRIPKKILEYNPKTKRNETKHWTLNT
jgi:hypothetical protein